VQRLWQCDSLCTGRSSSSCADRDVVRRGRNGHMSALRIRQRIRRVLLNDRLRVSELWTRRSAEHSRRLSWAADPTRFLRLIRALRQGLDVTAGETLLNEWTSRHQGAHLRTDKSGIAADFAHLVHIFSPGFVARNLGGGVPICGTSCGLARSYSNHASSGETDKVACSSTRPSLSFISLVLITFILRFDLAGISSGSCPSLAQSVPPPAPVSVPAHPAG
jgi:hypothetical protein